MQLGDVGVGMMGGGFTNGVSYNGSTDYLTGTMTGLSSLSSPTGSLSFWFHIDGGTGSNLNILSMLGASQDTVEILRTNGNKIQFVAANSSIAFSNSIAVSTASFTVDSTWHHLAISWATNHAAGSKVWNLYLDGSALPVSITDVAASNNQDYNGSVSFAASPTGSLKCPMTFSEVWINPGVFIDFTVSANLQKFILNSKPVYLGTDGSIPTGSAPLIYLRSPAAQAGVNSGTGGNFTVNGSPTSAIGP